MAKRKTDYKSSGVNIKLGDKASKILYEAAKKTWKNRKGNLGEVVELFSDLSGLRAINVGRLPKDTYMSLGFDGVGTKIELAERMAKHDTVAYDLFAMVCDDAVVRGAEPVLIGSILDVKSLGADDSGNYLHFVKKLADGYIGATREAEVVVINGEIAEVGARVKGCGPFNYNWGAGVVWFAKKERMFSGYEVYAGDKLVGLREKGLRSNGLSLVRKVNTKKHGKNWHEVMLGDKRLGELALLPSKIYTKAVVEMFGAFYDKPRAKIHGVAHITGGGIPEKLGRLLKPSGLGAYLDNLYDPCDLMLYCQEIGGVSDSEAYRTFNMGQGVIVATPEPDKVMDVAAIHNIESEVIGEVRSEPGIVIKNKGLNCGKEKELIF